MEAELLAEAAPGSSRPQALRAKRRQCRGCSGPPGASTVTQPGSGPGRAEPPCRPSVLGEEPQVPHSSGCDQGDVAFPRGCLVLTGPSRGGLLAWFHQSAAVAAPQPGDLKPQLLTVLQLEAGG